MKPKLTTQDLKAIAYFNRIIKNYLKMKRIQESKQKEFHVWFSELKKLAVSEYGFTTADDFDENAWQCYWLDGLEPHEALNDDAANAI